MSWQLVATCDCIYLLETSGMCVKCKHTHRELLRYATTVTILNTYHTNTHDSSAIFYSYDFCSPARRGVSATNNQGEIWVCTSIQSRKRTPCPQSESSLDQQVLKRTPKAAVVMYEQAKPPSPAAPVVKQRCQAQSPPYLRSAQSPSAQHCRTHPDANTK